MNLTQPQILSIVAVVALTVAYLLAKVLDAKIEKLDLEFFSIVTGCGAWAALIWTLNNFGAFNAF